MAKLSRILVTGASGFIGQALCRELLKKGFCVRAVVRSERKAEKFKQSFSSSILECIALGEMSAETDWELALQDVNIIVHLAARVHVIHDECANPLVAYREVNVRATQRLGLAAAAAGVKRLIFLSSIGVNGNATQNYSFTEATPPNPHSKYAISKWEAEQELHEISNSTRLEVVIIRPPIVYGREVKANFLSLLKLVKSGLPAPLAGINNHRSLIYVENLADAIIICMNHKKAAGQTYLVCDGEPVSTPDLIQKIAIALRKKARLWYFPPSLLSRIAKLLGKGAITERLLGSLVVDSSKIKQDLGWEPPYTLEEALQRDFSDYAKAKIDK